MSLFAIESAMKFFRSQRSTSPNAWLATLSKATTALALVAVGTTQAATYSVSNCADNGAGSLRWAVESANTNPGADVINFALTCSTIVLASTIRIGESVNLIGPGASVLTITAPSSRAFLLEPLAAAPAIQEVTLSGLRFANTTGAIGELGGAMGSFRTNLGIRASVFEGNDVSGRAGGGAIYFESASGEQCTLNIDYTSFLNNGLAALQYLGGGAILQVGPSLVTVRRSLFRQNGAAEPSASGGAILSRDASALLIIESGFYANSANAGGAISTNGIGTTRVIGSSFVGNSARGLAIETDFGGGAIDNNLSALTIENSTFAANTVNGIAVGAAIASRGATVTLLNSTIAKNRVRSSATTNGGLAVFSAPGSGNAVAALNLRNTVVSVTLAVNEDQRNDVWVEGRGIAANFLSSTSLASVVRYGTALTQNPGGALLGNAENNGGITIGEQSGSREPLLTMLIGSGSALINAGNNTDAVTLTTDQRGLGFPRVLDAVVDIGAIEYPSLVTAEAPSVPTLPTLGLILCIALVGFAVSIARHTHKS